MPLGLVATLLPRIKTTLSNTTNANKVRLLFSANEIKKQHGSTPRYQARKLHKAINTLRHYGWYSRDIFCANSSTGKNKLWSIISTLQSGTDRYFPGLLDALTGIGAASIVSEDHCT